MREDRDDDSLSWDDSVFRDEHVFEIDYLPETFRHRDAQMETLKYALRPAVRGSRPLNIVMRGPPGTGKTTAIQILFDELTAQTDVKVVRINCQVDATRYAVFSRIRGGLADYDPPKAGTQFRELFTDILNKITSSDSVLIVALDDINYLFYEGEASDTLYSLLRAHEAQSGAKIGVICVSSDLELDVLESVDKRVKSVFQPEEVYFNKYGKADIVDILEERVKRGFKENVLGSGVIEHVGKITAEEGGDIRVGLDLLRRAGMNAEMRGSKSVGIEDVDESYEKSKLVHLSRRLQELTSPESALVEIIANQDREGPDDIYDRFHNETSLGYTRYSEMINNLNQLGIIEIVSDSPEDHTSYEAISLQYDSDIILERI